MSAGIVILGGPFPSTAALYNFLSPQFTVLRVIIENRRSRFGIFKKRVVRFGVGAALGQSLFRFAIAPALEFGARGRIREITKGADLDFTSPPAEIVTRVSSANDAETVKLLRELQPAAVVVNGTRILSGEVLQAAPRKFINLHAGITPRYRGVHGAYWALAEGRPDLCGCTLHMIDEGIDTGGVLAQATIYPNGHDNFASYQVLQLAAGMKLLPAILQQFISGNTPATIAGCDEESKLWSHPTAWEYVRRRITKGVK
jgi:methionyl-tRNA formyltransferase